MSQNKNTPSVYSLSIQGCPFYIGCTISPETRLRSHIYDSQSCGYKVSNYLISIGQIFDMNILAECSENVNLFHIESLYIDAFSSKFDLLNHAENKLKLGALSIDRFVPAVLRKFYSSISYINRPIETPFYEKETTLDIIIDPVIHYKSDFIGLIQSYLKTEKPFRTTMRQIKN